MQIVTQPLQAPSICIICEQSPDSDYVDTKYVFDPPGPTHLNGKKYVCVGCVTAMANLFGFKGHGQVKAFEDKIHQLESLIKEFKLGEQIFEDLKKFSQSVGAPKPKAPAKKAQ